MSSAFLEKGDSSLALNTASLTGIAQSALFVLKATDAVDWSWAWTFAPLSVFGGFIVLVLLLFGKGN